MDSSANYGPPPPPPLAGGSLPARRLQTQIPPEAPACVQNAMMTKDKKPFTYTPGGIDLSQIRSPRMAQRISRNANMEGVTNTPKPSINSQYDPQLKTTPPTPPIASSASGMPVQVFPTGPPAPPPPPKAQLAPQSQSGRKSPSMSLEPPPMGCRPEIKIPPNPMANLRKSPRPEPKEEFWKEEYIKERSKSPLPVSQNEGNRSNERPKSSVELINQNDRSNSSNFTDDHNDQNYRNGFTSPPNASNSPTSAALPRPLSPIRLQNGQTPQQLDHQKQEQLRNDKLREEQQRVMQQQMLERKRQEQLRQEEQTQLKEKQYQEQEQRRKQQYEQQQAQLAKQQEEQRRQQELYQQQQQQQYQQRVLQQQQQQQQQLQQQKLQQQQQQQWQQQQQQSDRQPFIQQRWGVPVKEPNPEETKTHNNPPQNNALGSLYIPSVPPEKLAPTLQQQGWSVRQKSEEENMMNQPTPPWMAPKQQPQSPEWAIKTDSTGGREHIIPIMFEQSPTQNPRFNPMFSNYETGPSNAPGYQSPNPHQFVNQYTNVNYPHQQPQRIMSPPMNPTHMYVQGARVIPIQMDGFKGPTSQSPTIIQNDPRGLQHQSSWGNGGPNQSKSFRVLQKITDTGVDDQGNSNDDDNEVAELQQPHYSKPLGQHDMNQHQLRKLQLNEQKQGNFVHPSEQQVPEAKMYMGGNIPSRSFKILQSMITPENAASENNSSDTESEKSQNITNPKISDYQYIPQHPMYPYPYDPNWQFYDPTYNPYWAYYNPNNFGYLPPMYYGYPPPPHLMYNSNYNVSEPPPLTMSIENNVSLPPTTHVIETNTSDKPITLSRSKSRTLSPPRIVVTPTPDEQNKIKQKSNIENEDSTNKTEGETLSLSESLEKVNSTFSMLSQKLSALSVNLSEKDLNNNNADDCSKQINGDFQNGEDSEYSELSESSDSDEETEDKFKTKLSNTCLHSIRSVTDINVYKEDDDESIAGTECEEAEEIQEIAVEAEEEEEKCYGYGIEPHQLSIIMEESEKSPFRSPRRPSLESTLSDCSTTIGNDDELEFDCSNKYGDCDNDPIDTSITISLKLSSSESSHTNKINLSPAKDIDNYLTLKKVDSVTENGKTSLYKKSESLSDNDISVTLVIPSRENSVDRICRRSKSPSIEYNNTSKKSEVDDESDSEISISVSLPLKRSSTKLKQISEEFCLPDIDKLSPKPIDVGNDTEYETEYEIEEIYEEIVEYDRNFDNYQNNNINNDSNSITGISTHIVEKDESIVTDNKSINSSRSLINEDEDSVDEMKLKPLPNKIAVQRLPEIKINKKPIKLEKKEVEETDIWGDEAENDADWKTEWRKSLSSTPIDSLRNISSSPIFSEKVNDSENILKGPLKMETDEGSSSDDDDTEYETGEEDEGNVFIQQKAKVLDCKELEMRKDFWKNKSQKKDTLEHQPIKLEINNKKLFVSHCVETPSSNSSKLGEESEMLDKSEDIPEAIPSRNEDQYKLNYSSPDEIMINSTKIEDAEVKVSIRDRRAVFENPSTFVERKARLEKNPSLDISETSTSEHRSNMVGPLSNTQISIQNPSAKCFLSTTKYLDLDSSLTDEPRDTRNITKTPNVHKSTTENGIILNKQLFSDADSIISRLALRRHNSSQRSSQEESEVDEEDSGVTSDMSRHISETDTESECFPELRKMSRYQRAATHSRLFKLLQEECGNGEDTEDLEATNQPKNIEPITTPAPSKSKIIHNVSITRKTNPNALKEAETMAHRRERLCLPLQNRNSIESTSSSGSSPTGNIVSEKLVNELVQSLLLKKKCRYLKDLPLEKLQSYAKRVLLEDIDNSIVETSSSSDDIIPTHDSTPALTPIEFTNSYSEYYDTWDSEDHKNKADILPSKAFKVLQEQQSGNRKPWSVRCPRVLSSKSINRDLSRVAETHESDSADSVSISNPSYQSYKPSEIINNNVATNNLSK